MQTVLTGSLALDYALAVGGTLSRYGTNGRHARHGISWEEATRIADGDAQSLFIEADVAPRADGWHSLELGSAEVRMEGGRPRELRCAPGPRRGTAIDVVAIQRELEVRDGCWVEVPAGVWPADDSPLALRELATQPTHFVLRRGPEGAWAHGLFVAQPAPGRLEGWTREDLERGGEPSLRGELKTYDDGSPYEVWEGPVEVVALPWAPVLSPFPAVLGPPLDAGRAEVLVLCAVARLALDATLAAGTPVDTGLSDALETTARWCRGGAAGVQLERAAKITSKALERAVGTPAGAATDCVDWTCAAAALLERRPSPDGVDGPTVQRVLSRAADALVAAGIAPGTARARVDAACAEELDRQERERAALRNP